jgi:hypothetical protein
MGHVKGNIQLICQCVNRMKNNHPDDSVIEFFDTYYKKRKERHE